MKCKKMTRWLICLATLVLLIGCLGISAMAVGTVPQMIGGVYRIGTADELMWFADYVNTYDAECTLGVEVDAVLTADIDMTGKNWIPIGIPVKSGKSVGYGGNFDGGGYTVSGINCNYSSNGSDSLQDCAYGGFFALANSAEISNLTVKGSIHAEYTGSNLVSTIVGGMVAVTDGSSFENCTFEGQVSGDGTYEVLLGGFAGSSVSDSFTNCLAITDLLRNGTHIDYGGFVCTEDDTSSYTDCYYVCDRYITGSSDRDLTGVSLCTHETVTDLKCDCCGMDIVVSVTNGDTTKYYTEIVEEKGTITVLADCDVPLSIYFWRVDNLVINEGATLTLSDDDNFVFGSVSGTGTIAGGKLICCGEVSHVTMSCKIQNDGNIKSGTFLGEILSNNTINGGTFQNKVVNQGTIYGGTFNGQLANETDATIKNLKDDDYTFVLGDSFSISNSGNITCEDHIWDASVVCRLCGKSCTHENVTDLKCDACGKDIVASLTIDEEVSYFLSLEEALDAANTAGEGVVTLHRDDEMNNYTSSDPDVDLVIEKDVTLKQDNTLEFYGNISGDGTIDGTGLLYLEENASISGITADVAVYCYDNATIEGGTFNNFVMANSEINGGTFNGSINMYHSVSVNGGSFKCDVQLDGTINAGTFENVVTNRSGKIYGGSFEGTVNNESTIYGGTFEGVVNNYGDLYGGTFIGTLKNIYEPDVDDGCTTYSIIGVILNLADDDYTIALGENAVVDIPDGSELHCEDHIWSEFGICRLCTANCDHKSVTNLECDDCGSEFVATLTIGDDISYHLFLGHAFNAANEAGEGVVTMYRDEMVGDFTCSDPDIDLVIDKDVTLEVFSDFNFHGDISGEGAITGAEELSMNGSGTISGNLTFDNEVNIESGATILGGTFNEYVYTYGTIEGGTFTDEVKLYQSGTIKGGTFNGTADIKGSVYGGTFNANMILDRNNEGYHTIKNLVGDEYTISLGQDFTLNKPEGALMTCEDHILKDGICRLCDAEPAYMITDKNGTIAYGEKYIDLDKNLSPTTVKITLLKDQSEEDTNGSIGLNNIQMVTLDLNGHTLARRICITNTDLTIMDSVGTGNIAFDSGANVGMYGGKVTLDASLDLLGEKEGNSYWAVCNASEDPVKLGTDLVIPRGVLMMDGRGYESKEIAYNSAGWFHKHTASSEAVYDEEYHWNKCTGCIEKLNLQKHSILGIMVGNEGEHWNTCVNCDVKLNLGEHTGGKPNCTQQGSCATCKMVYLPIDADNHDYVNGICSRCQDVGENDDRLSPTVEGVTRLAGNDRLVTSCLIADQTKAMRGLAKFPTIIVASGSTFADALPGSYLAAVKNAPIILTLEKDKYINQTADYIKENLVEGGTVYILGGESAVPASMEKALDGFNVQRVAGDDRFKTNLEILKTAGIQAGTEILVCEGKGYADSLSASATGKPILLVYKKLTAEQKAFLASVNGCTFTIVGGTTAVPEALAKEIEAYGAVTRLAGKDRLETSTMVAERYFKNATTAVVAYGWNFPDGLCGGTLAFATDSPLILTHSKEKLYGFTAAYTTKAGIRDGYILGGDGLISDAASKAIFGLTVNETIDVLK